MGKKPTGRPSKRTPEVEAAIIRALNLGLDYVSAAEIVGITAETLRAWRAGDESFSADCKRAKGNGKVQVSASLMKAIKGGNVTAMIFWLKTRTIEFREQRAEDVMDGAILAEQFHKRLVELENYVPSEPNDG